MAAEIYKAIDLDRFQLTGSAAPARSLRFHRLDRKVQRASLLHVGPPEIGVQLLITKYQLIPPLVGNFDLQSWLVLKSLWRSYQQRVCAAALLAAVAGSTLLPP